MKFIILSFIKAYNNNSINKPTGQIREMHRKYFLNLQIPIVAIGIGYLSERPAGSIEGKNELF